MEKLSKIFNVLLLFSLIIYLLHVGQLYDTQGPLKAFGIPTREITALAAPYIFLSVIYFIAFLFSLYFNIKKKYIINVWFSGTMIVFAMFVPLLMKTEFVHNIMDQIFHG